MSADRGEGQAGPSAETQEPCEACGLRADARWTSNLCPYCEHIMGGATIRAPQPPEPETWFCANENCGGHTGAGYCPVGEPPSPPLPEPCPKCRTAGIRAEWCDHCPHGIYAGSPCLACNPSPAPPSGCNCGGTFPQPKARKCEECDKPVIALGLCADHVKEHLPQPPSEEPRCPQTLTPNDMTYECQRPAGHTGDHRSGSFSWWPVPSPSPTREEPGE